MKTFIYRDGQEYGPYTDEELWGLIASGNVISRDYARREDWTEWKTVTDVLSQTEAPSTILPPLPLPSPPLPQIAHATTNRSRTEPSTDQKPQKRLPSCGILGCLGFIPILVTLLVIGLLAPDPNKTTVEGSTATIEFTANPEETCSQAGKFIAAKVYEVAKGNPSLKTIVINVSLDTTTLSDKYGNSVGDKLPMGTITVTDLDEVRRYAIDGAYIESSDPMVFGAQISQMDHADSLEK